MAAKNSFWQLLTDIGREHDRQLSGLLDLVRELRQELNRSTGREEILGLRSEVSQLKHKLALSSLHASEMKHQLALSGLSNIPLPDLKGGSIVPSVHRNGESSSQSAHALPITQLDSNLKPAPQADTAADVMVMSTASTTQKSTGYTEPGFTTLHQPATPEHQPSPPVPEQVVVASSPKMPDRFSASDSHNGKRSPQMWALTRSSSFVIPEATSGVAGFLDRHLFFITTTQFETFTAILIMINTIIMMLESQYLGLKAGYVTGFPGIDVPLEESWPGAAQAFFITDRIFTAIFFVELMLRIMRFRIEFFKVPLNWIDIVAVLASVFQALVEDVELNPTVIRLLRVVRPVRSIRFLKNNQIQKSLNIIQKCLKASVVTLFWSLCLLMMVQCMIGMVAGQIAQEFVADLSNPERGRHEVFRYFGTFTRCLVTMFEIHMANWASPCRVVMNNIGESWGNALVFYRCVFGFALMSVLGAVFVQQAMSVQQQDHELTMLRKQKETDRYTKKLQALFRAMDTDGDGQLSRAEFAVISENQEIKAWMESLDINPDDLQGLFDLLDTGDGFVSSEEFLMGATRVRGNARNLDMAQLIVTMGKMERMMEHNRGDGDKLETLLKKFDALEEVIREKEKCGEPMPRESTWSMVVNKNWANAQ